MANPNSLHSTDLLQKLWVQFYMYYLQYYYLTDLPFQVFYIPFYIDSKDIYNQLITNDIHLVLITKIDICAIDNKCVQKF